MTKEAAFRREAAERFRPDRLEYLFVAEAPPGDVSRYFYFDDVRQGDSLYLEVAKALFLSLSVDRLRERKARTLERMRDQGMWLIDVAEEPNAEPVDDPEPAVVEAGAPAGEDAASTEPPPAVDD